MRRAPILLALGAALFATLGCPPKPGAVCQSPAKSCGSECVNTATDPRNCGACGAACPSGQSCASGACVCGGGATACGTLCASLTADPTNCGGCGNACLTGAYCDGGSCACEGSRVLCSGRCVDPQSDVANCGGCEKPCGQGQVCFAGQCQASCQPDGGQGVQDAGALQDCGGSCVDTLTDPANCGGCGQACGAGQLCSSGGCACGGGTLPCGPDGGCVDVTRNPQHCGACGTACPSYESCQAGGCGGGPALFAACYHSGLLVPLQSDGGAPLAPWPVVAPSPLDGGLPVPANPNSLVFTDPKTLWLLDTGNAQVDVLDLSTWPPTPKVSIGTGGPDYPNQLLLCAGKVVVVVSGNNTVETIDPMTYAVGAIALGALDAGNNPFLAACDGAHTLYVTDSVGQAVRSVDLTAGTVTATLLVPDAGAGSPDPSGIAYASVGGGELLVTLENLAPSYCPTGAPADVLELPTSLQSIAGAIDPGPTCVNAGYLALSPDGSLAVEACGGDYGFCPGGNGSGTLALIDVATGTVRGLVTVPLGAPSGMAFLASGQLAVADSASGSVALLLPDGGSVSALAACPAGPDGGPGEFVGAVIAAP
ncbi:MAG: MXAN_6577-like cysteine-rich protein [Deltaproteobacteria bacterium]